MGTYKITHSTELMENYVQATIMAPDRKFQALQRSDGGALLFSIGQDGSFNVIAESSGAPHGWAPPVSLSAGYPGATCRLFGLAERADGSIQLAMALHGAGDRAGDRAGDTLFLGELIVSMTGTVDVPSWVAFAYDSPETSRPKLEIAGIFLSEAADAEFVAVDVVRDPASPTKEIVRYYVDSAKSDGRAWHLHDVPVDIESGAYTTVLGRTDGAGVDGLYVGGQIDGSPQIIYTPLFNELRPSRHPGSDYLRLTAEADLVADALATCRNPDDTTDLYAAANGRLYRFASTNQQNGAVAAGAAQSPLFRGVKDLFAIAYGKNIMVWGRNADNAIFYTVCPRDKLDDAKAWSVPVPILNGVEQVSPYVNRANSANTIFAHAGSNSLRMGVKSPDTGVWSWRDVALPVTDAKAPARKFNSYTTHIRVTDADHSPADGLTVSISASSVTGVYINHLYYTVGPSAIHVPTDTSGSITIVEAVPRLTGTQFTVSVVGDSTTEQPINPMDKAFRKATDLQSVDELRRAKVTRYVNGKKTEPRNLIRDGVDDQTLQQVANLNKQCAAVYANPTKPPTQADLMAIADASPHQFPIPTNASQVDAGDMFQFLEARAEQLEPRRVGALTADVEAVGEPVSDLLIRWFEGACELVVKIDDAIYRCALRVVEDVVSAIRWVFDRVVAAVEDLIEFLKYLFEWDDFKRTKDVLKNVVQVFLTHQCGQLPTIRAEFDKTIDSMIEAIDAWAGIEDNLVGLGDAGSGRMSSQGTSDGPDAPGTLMQHHFQGNVHNGSADDSPNGTKPPPPSVLAVLEKALEDEKATLDEAFDQLRDLVRDAPTLSVVEILKRIAAIIGDAALRSVQVVVDALLGLFMTVAEAILKTLDTPIHIPVISDILNAIGIPDVSMLDIICWVAAVPVTIGYKLGSALAGKGHEAPFPDNAETAFLIEVKDFDSLVAVFKQPGPQRSVALATANTPLAVSSGGPVRLSPTAALAVSVSLHSVSGVCGFVSAFVDSFESLIPTKLVPTALSRATIVAAIVGGLSRAVANLLVPRDPIQEPANRFSSDLFTAVFLLNKVVFGYKGHFQADDDQRDYRATGAGIDAVLVIPALVITVLHFVDLANAPAGKNRTMAILDETSYVATYIGRVLYTVIVTGLLDSNEEAKVGASAAMGLSSVVHGALQLTEAAVEGLEP